jgi:hypothetical protein
MTTFQVYGSHGELTVASASGRVLAYEPIGDGEYRNITFFNIAEWRQVYSGEVLRQVDILDIGYWTEEGEYTPPVADWRAEKGGCA